MDVKVERRGPRLTRGNSKLGRGIWAWSIPAGETCPGASAACAVCYAMRGRYRTPSVRQLLASNLEATKAEGFADAMAAEIDRTNARVVRVHVAGDFYAATYLDAWQRVAVMRPAVRFYAYSRSWRVSELVGGLASLASLANVRLWFSADMDTGTPPYVPGVRVAWLQERAADVVPPADLVFRDAPARGVVARRIGLALVCPVENGSSKRTDCSTCRYCFYH